MPPEDKQRLLDYYENSLKEYGDNPKSVHWMDQKNQEIRFEILNKIADLNNKKILDVGCGLGDLYQFFISKNIGITYTGIDIVPEFIEKAQKSFPDIKFILKDVIEINEKYDYILASGVLSFKFKDSKNYYFHLIKKMFECAKSGVAFNVLNSSTHNTDDIYLTYSIEEVLNYCKTLTKNVEIISDYLPQDFTVYMYKDKFIKQ